jgi:hypothetical protein
MTERPDRTGPRFERRDVEPWSVARLGLAVVILTVVAVLAALFAFRALKGGPPDRRVASPALPPEPRLQTDEPSDLARVQAAWHARLTTYGWVDRGAGLVHMPIDEAMRLVAQRGLPVRAPEGAPVSGRPADAGGTR